MQVALIGDDDSPQKQIIAKVLDSDRSINRVDLDPLAKGFNIRQRLIHCFIYAERSPSQVIIDQLQDANCPLVLIADTEHPSHLFISFDDFFTPKCLDSFWENIFGLRSLHDMEYQRNLFPMILSDEDNEEWDLLIAEKSLDSFNNNIERPRSSVASDLTEEQRKVLEYWSKGKPESEILSSLKMCRRKYFLILSEIKAAYGATTSRELLLKVK
jgi:hypothetical protein